MFIEQVATYIKENKLFNPKDNILIGLSGGADSVALLHALLELKYNVAAAHCNFHLRGDESDRDELFVSELCKRVAIPLFKVDFATLEYADRHKLSIEMAARELRYNWFEEIRVNNGYEILAIAHHRDDNIETLFLNLARGTGIRGLTAIKPINGPIRRPLLSCSRKEIISYLDKKGEKYVIDSTNQEDQFARNKVRLNIIPQMELINSACQNNIQRTIEYLTTVEQIYQEAITTKLAQIKDSNNNLIITKLLKEKQPKTLLYEAIYPLGFNSEQVIDLYNTLLQSEKKSFFSKTHQIIKSRDLLLIRELKEIPDEKGQTPPTLSMKEVEIDKSFKLLKNNLIGYFDREKIDRGELNIRKWKKGDAFIPFGMSGTKKLSDLFTDLKYTQDEKENQWLLTHKDEIIWVIGVRTDDRYKITKSTKKALIIDCKA